jgi:N6-L-threonylcarbamoyladenine synthase
VLILGIETTCDETGVAFVRNGNEILANIVISSADLHAAYGGVFPEHSSRRHIEALVPALKKAFKQSQVTEKEIDAIAVANGPGLIGPLLVGAQFAKGLAIGWNKPLIAVHHVEAHLYAAAFGQWEEVPLPALGVVLSGGHTLLLKISEIGHYDPISTTRDDAIGEAFDKVATLLGLPYPGGPQVERLAQEGKATLPFSPGSVKHAPLDFSFSGLKTRVLYEVCGQNGTTTKVLTHRQKADIAASFQEVAFSDVINKCKTALTLHECRSLLFGGGVCNNQRLRFLTKQHFPNTPLFFPSPELTLDNAAMIAGLASQKKYSQSIDIPVQTRIHLGIESQ